MLFGIFYAVREMETNPLAQLEELAKKINMAINNEKLCCRKNSDVEEWPEN